MNRPLLAFWLVSIAVSLLLTWPLLAGEVPAFRDGWHFYYPFACWLENQSSLWPMWNSADGVGTNVIGEMSSAMFYPGRVLMWLPALSVAQRLGIFTVVHLWLAAFTMFYAARQSGCARESASLAAISFAFCCPVLFQHTNIIYLVSAAWWPLIIAHCLSIVRGDPARWWLWCGSASMMLLGGDPQATLVAGLVTSICILWHVLYKRLDRSSLMQGGRFLFSIAAVTAITAVQWIPTWYWLQQSSRVSMSASAQSAGDLPVESSEGWPSNVPQLLRGLNTADLNSTSNQYAFSIAPWHLLTLIWGTSAGHYAPENFRWVSAWRAEPRMWIPSLSIGLLPLLLCLCALTHLRATREWRRTTLTGCTLIALFACLAMLGDYTPLWATRHVARWLDINVAGWPSDEVGGLSWLLTQCVPGYASLRYPAKWSVCFASGLCLLSAHGLDMLASESGSQRTDAGRVEGKMLRQLRRSTAIVAGITAVVFAVFAGVVSVPGGRAAVERWLQHAPVDAWHGRVHSSAAMLAVANSLLTTLIVSMVLFGFSLGSFYRNNPPRWRMIVLWLSLLELSWMAWGWLVTVDPQLAGRYTLADRLTSEKRPAWQPPRVWAAIGRADFEAWQSHRTDGIRSDLPVSAMATAQYQSLFQLGKLHLCSENIHNLTALGTLTPRALTHVRTRLAQSDDLRADNPALEEALAWLGVTHRLVHAADPHWRPIPNPRPIIEIPSADAIGIDVRVQSDDHWIVEVDTSGPSHLDLRWFQDGGWHARLTHADGRVLHTTPHKIDFGLFQSIPLPGGKWTVELRYGTPGLQLGAWITCGALIVVVLSGIGWVVIVASRLRVGL